MLPQDAGVSGDTALLQRLSELALPCAARLRARGERLAVADGTTGGLISAAFCTIPGATDFFQGGGTLYSLEGRAALFGLPPEAWRGTRGVSEPYALMQADAVRARFGAAWGIAESGSAGPGGHPHGAPAGTSCIAVAGPGITLARTIGTGSADRIANMAAFAAAALDLLGEALERAPA